MATGPVIPEQSVSRGTPALPGMQDLQIQTLQAFNQVIQSKDAFVAEVSSAIKDLRGAMGATAMYTPNSSVAAAIRSGGEAMLADAESSMRPPSVSASVRQAISGGSRAAPEAVEAATWSPPTSFRAGRQAGLKGIRAGLTAQVSQSISNMTLGGDYVEPITPYAWSEQHQSFENVRTGEFVSASTAQAAANSAEYYRSSTTGEVMDAASAAIAARRMARADVVRRGVAAMSSTGSLSAGVSAALPRVAAGLGVAGMAVGGGLQVAQFIADQRQANQPFQAVLGGSNAEGFGERIGGFMNRWNPSTVFGMGGANADRLYRGALDLYAGDRGMRNQAMDVGRDLYNQVGMTPDESMAVFREAARVGQDSLGMIAESLRNVTQTAREAGMNAQEARAEFQQAFTEVGRMYRGSAPGLIAEAQTSALTAMGRGWEGVSIGNTSQFQLQAASMRGMSVSQYQALVTGPGGERTAVEDQRAAARRAVGLYTRPGAEAIVAQFMQENNIREGQPIETVDPALRRELGRRLLEANAIVNPNLAASQLAMMADIQGVTPGQVGEVTADIMLGFYDPGRSLDARAESFEASAAPRGEGDIRRLFEEELGFERGQSASISMSRGHETGRGRERAGSIYASQMAESGRRNPILEQILQNYDNSRRFLVQTKDGPVVVGNHELLRDFADQAARGDVQIVEGANAGQSIAEAFNIPQESLSTAAAASASQTYTGKTFDAPSGGPGQGGTVTVQAGPELQRWIDLQATGGVNVDWRQTGIPPTGVNDPMARATGR